jgi:type I restriction-modification system DNA methylase subunit
MSVVDEFMRRVVAVHKTGSATEHSYRPALEALFNSLSEHVTALNEPKRVEFGAPDFIIHRGDMVIGHAEAKDIGTNLHNLKDSNKEQQARYLAALPNLIYTNCLDWDFYRSRELVASVTIAGYLSSVQPYPDRYSELENLLHDFIARKPQKIDSPRELAEIMAGKASLIKDILFKALCADKGSQTELMDQHKAFQEHLIHDITQDEFADIYAETVAYGMFAARLHDVTLGSFSRQEALKLLPKSNPFLRSLFGYIAGNDLDSRITWIIDDLADAFQATDLPGLMKGFAHLARRQDPFLHFYETFLAAYNPVKRKARGVWYTPEPVVRFIVHVVDDILQKDFGLADGLADISMVTVDWDTGQTDKKGRPTALRKDVHRVQILDPATGTGTFLAEVVKQVAPRVKDVAAGMWSNYIERHLIPRLHGFELLMASYAMCHIKLDMILSELGYQPSGSPPRLSVFLTNSLEEGEPANQRLPFAQWLSNEAKQANAIKRDIPIMCVIGNPPYNPSSKNTNPWILEKMKAYKAGVDERKVHLSDDYMKFIRFAEDLIIRSGSGVVAMVTNNSFLDGTTQRGMRRHLLESFDRIDILNLHGDIRARQSNASDENVFDITQGVAISIMRRTPKGKARVVRYAELIGSRKDKYEALMSLESSSKLFQELAPEPPYYFFVPKSLGDLGEDFSLDQLFVVKSSGIQTKNDAVAISWTPADRDSIVSDFQSKGISELKSKYPPMAVWDTEKAQKEILEGEFERRTITYRPFDVRHTILTKRSGGFLGRPRYDVMKHIREDDMSLIVNKKHVGDYFSHASVTLSLAAHGVHYLGNRGQDFVCPLYLSGTALEPERRINFDQHIFSRIRRLAAGNGHDTPDELAVFDYVYGVLHCPAYREAYAASLKIDFPRIPWPSSVEEFWDVSSKGAQLRRLHLLDPVAIGPTPYAFRGVGDAVVVKPHFKERGIWINRTQYFDDVPEISWHLYFGGYQPAQKWLKDRKGRKLLFDEVRHYQRLLKSLSETDRIMQSITLKALRSPSVSTGDV